MKYIFSSLAAMLCVLSIGMTYSAFADTDLTGIYIKPEYRAAYEANSDNPNIHMHGGDSVLTSPTTYPELPTETRILFGECSDSGDCQGITLPDLEDLPVEIPEEQGSVDFNRHMCGNETDEGGLAGIGGDGMDGLLGVQFFYDDFSISEEMVWTSGFVTDGEYLLKHNGDTFSNPWRLEAIAENPKTITSILLTGILKPEFIVRPYGEWRSIAFDIFFNPELTPGSGHGEPFAATAYPEHIQQPTGTYGVPVTYKGLWYGDLFNMLVIDIPGGWDGSTGEFFDFVAFLADTDCIEGKALDVVELKASANPGGVQLSWADENRGGVGAYVVFRTTAGNYRSCVAGGKCKDPEMTTVYTTSYMDNTAKPGQSYRYAVLELEGNETPADALAVLRQKYSDGTLAITEAVTP